MVCFGLFGAATSRWEMTVNTAASSKFDTFWDTLSYAMNGLVFFFAGVSAVNFFIRSSEVGLLSIKTMRTFSCSAMSSSIIAQGFFPWAFPVLLALQCELAFDSPGCIAYLFPSVGSQRTLSSSLYCLWPFDVRRRLRSLASSPAMQ